jgi:hypothetical protein
MLGIGLKVLVRKKAERTAEEVGGAIPVRPFGQILGKRHGPTVPDRGGLALDQV